MKKSKMMMMTMGTMLAACTTSNNPTIDQQSVVESLSLEDKAHFVIGTGMKGVSGDQAVVGATQNIVPGSAGTTYPLDSLGIPAIVLADGPAGLRIDATRENDEQTYYCTHFPIGTLLASTWNTELVEQVGKAIGEEVKEYGVDVLLAPAINIMRNPLCGRNFEYYSEDPLVAGKTGAAYIRGIQSNGVGTSIKHFAANNQETNRMNTDARVSQRALREIYLRGFEIAIKDSKPWTVMTSYNYINGTYASESKELVTDLLRGEWGYEGTVMTDWYGGKDGAKQMWAGNDMLQPGKEEQFDSIVAGVRAGKLAEADLDRNIGRILSLIERTPRYNGYKFSNKPDLAAHAEVTRQSATEGMVLLKNNGALPFDKQVKTVALYGCTSYDFIAGGTGSGNVNRAYVVSLLDGMRNSGYEIPDALRESYESYIAAHKAKVKAENEELAKKDSLKAMFLSFLPTPLPTEMALQQESVDEQAKQADIAVITFGRLSGEFLDRQAADFSLSAAEEKMLEQVCTAYHAAGKKVVVLLNIGGVIETASWKDKPDAILCAWQAGQEGGNSVVDVLSGKQSPSGKLTMTWPVALADVASTKNFPIDEEPRMDILKTGQKGQKKNVDYTNYEEDIYVGYRYFDSFGVPVSFPFGYGLSYTSFDYSNAAIEEGEDEYKVSVTVTNSGEADGKEIVELYVAAPNSKAANKPEKELRAYAKTKTLKPGESQTLILTVKADDLASFDASQSAWIVEAGEYQFLVGSSSQDIKAELKAQVKPLEHKVGNLLRPQVELNLLHR